MTSDTQMYEDRCHIFNYFFSFALNIISYSYFALSNYLVYFLMSLYMGYDFLNKSI